MIMDKEEFDHQKAAINWDEFYKDKNYNGYEQIKAISFSHTIDKNRGQYYLAFSEAENNIYNR